MRSASMMGWPMKYCLLSLHNSAIHSRNSYATLVTHWGSDFRPAWACGLTLATFLFLWLLNFWPRKTLLLPSLLPDLFTVFFPLCLFYLFQSFWHDTTDPVSMHSAQGSIFWLQCKVQEYHLLIFKLKLVKSPPALPWGTMRTMTFSSGLVWASTSPTTWEGSYMDSYFWEYTLGWVRALVGFCHFDKD